MLYADSARNRLTGIGLASGCFLTFSMIDSTAKWLVLHAMPIVMVVWLRFVTHALFATALLLPLKGRSLFSTRHWGLHAARTVMLMLMTGLNFWALRYLQLTMTTSIFFTVPIITALFGARLLGERLDARRWLAVFAGFLGVLVIVHPWGMGFHPAMLLSITNAFVYSAFNLTTRRLAAYDSPETIQVLPAVGAAIGLTPLALAIWEWPQGPLQWALVCLLGLVGGTGHYLLAIAHRYAPATTIAPFLDQQIFYMALFGYLLFGDVPRPTLWLGAAIVVASGLYLFGRDRARFAPQS